MTNIKALTLLHSNDLHGDFLAEKIDRKLLGGVSMLSGYINSVRESSDSVLYAIAGDMLRGSVIDSEFKGISTIEIMNLIGPDVVCLGNHELDYGMAHLVFLEKCAKFPIVNANLYIKSNRNRLFQPYKTIKINGMKVLFIGVLTQEIMDYAKQDELLGTFIDVEDAAAEVGNICNNYRTLDIDLTVLLTHIGFEQDKALAALLDPRWGIDLLIGGHSHTVLSEPCVVNGIPIVQAGTGTDMIGRFDIKIDTDNNRIDSYTWETVPIDEAHCQPDESLIGVIEKYKEVTDLKFGRLLSRFTKKLTHPVRYRETELGNLFAEILRENLGLDIMLLGSGSIRADSMGPIVRFGDLKEGFPYDDWVYCLYPNGAQLKRMVTYILRDEAFRNETEFYQFSRGFSVVYDYAQKKIESLSLNGEPIDDAKIYTVGLQRYHVNSFDKFLGLPLAEVESNRKSNIVSTSCFAILDEYLSVHGKLSAKVEGRIVVKGLEQPARA